jgi:hypothetical protein
MISLAKNLLKVLGADKIGFAKKAVLGQSSEEFASLFKTRLDKSARKPLSKSTAEVSAAPPMVESLLANFTVAGKPMISKPELMAIGIAGKSSAKPQSILSEVVNSEFSPKSVEGTRQPSSKPAMSLNASNPIFSKTQVDKLLAGEKPHPESPAGVGKIVEKSIGSDEHALEAPVINGDASKQKIEKTTNSKPESIPQKTVGEPISTSVEKKFGTIADAKNSLAKVDSDKAELTPKTAPEASALPRTNKVSSSTGPREFGQSKPPVSDVSQQAILVNEPKLRVEPKGTPEVFEAKTASKISNLEIRHAEAPKMVSPSATASPNTVKESQAVATIQNIVEKLSKFSSNATVKVNLNVESRGNVWVSAERMQKAVAVNVAVDNNETKQWLASRVSQLGEKATKFEIEVAPAKTPTTKPISIAVDRKLTTAEARQIIEQTVKLATETPAKNLAAGLRVKLAIEKIGPTELKVSTAAENVRVEILPANKGSDTLRNLMSSTSQMDRSPQFVSQVSEILEVAAGKPNDAKVATAKTVAVNVTEVKSFTETLLKAGEVIIPAGKKADATGPQPNRQPVSKSNEAAGEKTFESAMMVEKSKTETTPANPRPTPLKEDIRFMAADTQSVFLSEETAPAIFTVNLPPTIEFHSAEVIGRLVMPDRVERSAMPEMIEKITEIAEGQAKNHGEKIEVQMEVEDIGTMRVDAVRRHDGIELQVRVDNNETRRMLEIQLIPLVEQMQKDGINIGKLEVSVRHHDESATQQKSTENSSPQEQQSSRRPNGSANSRQSAGAFGDGHGETPTEPRRFGYNSFEVLV